MLKTVRPWRPQDRDVVLALNAELQEHERTQRPCRRPGPEMTEAYVAAVEAQLARKGEDGVLFVAEGADGRVLGFATYFIDQDEPEQEPLHARIEDIVVAAPARWQGIGRALIAAACRFASMRGVGRVVLSVLTTNAEAIAAYRCLGFRPVLLTLKRMLDSDGQRAP
jgi:GNAT superfamily N-acetyltransferase